jgi:hypothetical protein
MFVCFYYIDKINNANFKSIFVCGFCLGFGLIVERSI